MSEVKVMRHLLISLFIITAIFAGCSNSSGNPTMPGTDAPQDEIQKEGASLAYMGSFEIDIETMTISQNPRSADYIYNITGFLPDKCPGGCFRFTIVNVVGTVLEIELTVENPLAIQVYDLRLEYLNLFGKTVLNPDNYTDFLSTPISGIKPFTAFAKDYPNRAFPVGPGGMDTQTMFLDFPPGSAAAVSYAITVSLPGNTLDPYMISEMAQSGALTTSGGNATISCKVDDHQDNVSAVYLNSTPFTGGPRQMLPDPLNPGYFKVDISNTQGALVGDYNQLIMALSPNGQNVSTYDFVEITVSTGAPEDPIAIIDTLPDPPNVFTSNALIIFDGSRSYDPDGGPITLYEWDFKWDGNPVNFDPDIIGADAIVEFDYMCADGVYQAALRVTDDDTPAGVSEIASVEVTVTSDFEEGYWESGYHFTDENIRGDVSYHTGQPVCSDSTGLTHIVTKISTLLIKGIHHRTFDGITMSPPELIPGVGGSVSTVSCSVDGNDDLHVAWIRSYNVQHTSTSGGAFTGIIDDIKVSEPDYYCRTLNMERNDDGHIMITWLYSDIDMYPFMFEYSLNTGSGFSPAADVGQVHIRTGPSGGGGLMLSPVMVSTPNGYFHQLIRTKIADQSSHEQYWHFVYNGSNWEAPRVAMDLVATGPITDLAACAGKDGSIHITGRNHYSNDMEYIRYEPVTDTWMPHKTITLNSHPWVHGPMGAVEIDENGLIHSVFVEESDDLLHLKIFCPYSDEVTIQNTPDYVIDSSLDNQIYGHADLFWDPDGNLLMACENNYIDYSYETVFYRLMYN